MKHLVLAISLVFGTLFSADAQFSLGGFIRSANQQFIEEAIRENVMLMRQEYQLEDSVTMQRYTWNAEAQFGYAEAFTVRTQQGYITHRDLVEPWQQDSHYTPYRGTQLRPIYSRTAIRTVKDSLWREVGTIAPLKREMLDKSPWDHVTDTLFHAQGLKVEPLSGEQQGWLVWLTTANRADSATAKLSLVTYRQTLHLEEGAGRCELSAPSTNEQVLGGLYLVPRYDGCGTITFLLQGIAVEEERGWMLLIPREEPASAEASQLPEGELTPIPTPNEALAGSGEASQLSAGEEERGVGASHPTEIAQPRQPHVATDSEQPSGSGEERPPLEEERPPVVVEGDRPPVTAEDQRPPVSEEQPSGDSENLKMQ